MNYRFTDKNILNQLSMHLKLPNWGLNDRGQYSNKYTLKKQQTMSSQLIHHHSKARRASGLHINKVENLRDHQGSDISPIASARFKSFFITVGGILWLYATKPNAATLEIKRNPHNNHLHIITLPRVHRATLDEGLPFLLSPSFSRTLALFHTHTGGPLKLGVCCSIPLNVSLRRSPSF